MSLKDHGSISVVDAKIQISSPAFFFPTTHGGPGQSGARARAASQASYPGSLSRNLNRHLKTGSGRRPWALHSIISTELSWPRMRFSVNQSRQSRLFQEIIIIYLLLTIDYKRSQVKDGRSSSPLETLMVSLFWCFSGPGCYWIISGYCVRVGLLK